jgi:hypothetical protein
MGLPAAAASTSLVTLSNSIEVRGGRSVDDQIAGADARLSSCQLLSV